MLKFPYGVRDFYALITEGYLYLDRTDRIPLLENMGKELLFLRPRRFGKSLLLSTLMNYYDVRQANQFDRLFGHLAIGKNPTPLHNRYLVMQWDFSYIKSQGTLQEMERSMHDQINEWISIFHDNYADLLTTKIRIYPDNSLASFSSAVAAANHTPYKLYLFIDEYDNFANEVMTGSQGENQQRYHDLVSGEGMFKTLFKNVKGAGAGKGLDRVFMTGVSPVVMSDISSGGNVNKHIYWRPDLNDLCGFREEEVAGLLAQVGQTIGFSIEKQAEALDLMRTYYNGSWFSEEVVGGVPGFPAPLASHIYNPTLVFHFLDYLQTWQRYPRQMLDDNLQPDLHRLSFIASQSKGEIILREAIRDEDQVTVPQIATRFGVKEMLTPDKQSDLLTSLLCYLGALTLDGETDDGKRILKIPNLVMRKLYAQRILELTLPTGSEREAAEVVANRLFRDGEMQPLATFIEQHYFPVYHNRDYQSFNEVSFKTLFLVLLHGNEAYIMDSEPTIQRRHGDLMMLIRPEMRHLNIYDVLLELKYVPLAKLIEDKQPLTGEEVQKKNRDELLAIDSVKQAFSDAKSQLVDYRQKLAAKYGDILKLRTYAVVALAFEKILWEEV